MKARKFFEERSDQSEVKARIVTKYFIAWAKVVMPTTEKHGGKIAYVDLYAGPGRYKDGAASTPLLVLQAAIKDPKIAQMLVSYFNDSKNENTATPSGRNKQAAGRREVDVQADYDLRRGR